MYIYIYVLYKQQNISKQKIRNEKYITSSFSNIEV